MSKRSPFITWLLAQGNRQDPVGDLARDLRADMDGLGDPDAPFDGESAEDLRAHLIRVTWESGPMEALDRAVAEYDKHRDSVT